MNASIFDEMASSFHLFAVQAIEHTHPDRKIAHAPYLQYLCDEIHDNLIEPGSKLVINLPPRMMKTWLGIFAVAWYLGLHPSHHVMLLTHSDRLVKNISYKIRKLMRSKWYRELFPHTRIAGDNASVGEFQTTLGGGVFATSMRGAIAGFGGELIVIDDPNDIVDAKYPDRLAQGNELFDTAIMSRLNAESNILIIQHRLHENDLSAHAARNWQFRKVALALIAPKNKIYELNDGSTWCRKKGSVLRPGQYNTSELKQLRKTSMFYFLQQQDQDKQGEAKILPKHFGTTPGFVPFGKRFISIDAGLKGGPANSYNVAQVWQVVGPHFYLLDQFRAQCSFLDFEPRVCALIKRYKPSAVLIENAANGVVLALRVERRFPSLLVLKVEPGNDSKSKRLARHRTAIQKGIIFLPEDAYWRIEYIEEFISFPGPFTDQVDATTMLLDSIDLLARVNAPQLLGAPYGIRTTTGPISNPAGATFYGPRGEAVVLSSGLKKRFF